MELDYRNVSSLSTVDNVSMFGHVLYKIIHHIVYRYTCAQFQKVLALMGKK